MAAHPIPQPLPGGFEQFDLADEVLEAESRKPWQAGTFSRTLLKSGDMRLVMISMEPGARMADHHADGALSIHVLMGAVRLRAESGEATLRAGQLAAFAASVRHEVEAVEPSAFLLTISWPESEKLKSMPHRGYGS